MFARLLLAPILVALGAGVGAGAIAVLFGAEGVLSAIVASIAATLFGYTIVIWRILLPTRRALEALSQRTVSGTDSDMSSDRFAQIAGLGEPYARAIESMNRLHGVVQDLSGTAGRIAIAAAEVSFAADQVQSKVHAQAGDAATIGESSVRISETVEQMARLTASAAESANQANRLGEEGQSAVGEVIAQMQHMSETAGQTATLIMDLETKSHEIERITAIINEIAGQTNLLALNAAIEAARAGEQGRGFAVVADEVRGLARKTGEAIEQIGSTVDEIGTGIREAASQMSRLAGVVGNGVGLTESVGAQLTTILDRTRSVDAEVEAIAGGASENAREVEQISAAIGSVGTHLRENEEQMRGVSEESLALSGLAEEMHSALAQFDLGTVHDRMREEAAGAAAQIGRIFEEAIDRRQMSLEDCFDRDYQPIAGTSPQKFKTRFDEFTDARLPAIQEPILERWRNVAYAGAVDDHGYFPTHNRRYSKPLTGDYHKDLLANRTKRIFSDWTGSRCGSHTQAFLLQTYKRDTGEVMHDISVPIYVKGRHWGGFRIGYGSEDLH